MGGTNSTVRKTAGVLPYEGRSIRVGIAGAGPAGLAIAGIISREAPGRFQIEVFERDSKDKDQGSGWDMNEPARKVMRRAGLDPATISHPDPKGETYDRCYTAQSDEPWLAMGAPYPLNRCFKSNPETNRKAMRDGLLAANPNIKINFFCGVFDIKPLESGGVIFLGKEGEELGEFDIGIDASGVATPLRKHRVPGSDIKDWYTGITAVGGIIQDPETELDPEVVRRLGQGSLYLIGDRYDSQKAMIAYLQRFGCTPEDHRAQFAVWVAREDMRALAEELGVPRSTKSTATSDKEETIEKAKNWIREQMGDKWKKMYVDCVDHMRNVEVRPIFMFNPKLKPSSESKTAFICVGDALHAMAPFTGTGGNFAVQDAGELSTFLVNYALGTESRDLITGLREVEMKCFNRAAEVYFSRGHSTNKTLIRILNEKNVTANWSLAKALEGQTGWTLLKRTLWPIIVFYMWWQKVTDYNMAPKQTKAKRV